MRIVIAFLVVFLVGCVCGHSEDLHVTFGPCRGEFYAGGKEICVVARYWCKFPGYWGGCYGFWSEGSWNIPDRNISIVNETGGTVLISYSAQSYTTNLQYDDDCPKTIYPVPEGYSAGGELAFFLSTTTNLGVGKKYKVVPDLTGLNPNVTVVASQLFEAVTWDASKDVDLRKEQAPYRTQFYSPLYPGCYNYVYVCPSHDQPLWGSVVVSYGREGGNNSSDDKSWAYGCRGKDGRPELFMYTGNEDGQAATGVPYGPMMVTGAAVTDTTSAESYKNVRASTKLCNKSSQCKSSCNHNYCDSDGSCTNKECFIATAALGTPLDARIEILRNWRDDSLETNKLGRVFVTTYYWMSPSIARFIEGRPAVRALVRGVVIFPSLFFIERMTLSVAALFLGACGVVVFAEFTRKRRVRA